MNKPAPSLYHHEQYDCYECLGCREVMEVPFKAVLKNGQSPEFIKRNPENRLIWIELMQEGHSRCHLFKDADLARHDRERVRRSALRPAHQS